MKFIKAVLNYNELQKDIKATSKRLSKISKRIDSKILTLKQ